VTTVYLGWPLGYAAPIWKDYEPKHPLHILVSFAYLDVWDRDLEEGTVPVDHIQTTMLDSGAYTAHTTGKTIDPDALRREQQTGRWHESAALDAIGDVAKSEANWRASVAAGSDAWPTFHYGEPWDVLDRYAKESWKVGLGGIVGRPKADAIRWLDEVFRRAWPARFHLFGSIDERLLKRYPFHSCDSAVWFLLSIRYAGWSMPSGKHLTYKGPTVLERIPQARYKVDVYAERGARMTAHWRKVWRAVDTLRPPRPSEDRT